jgi:hypothetical protein
MAVRNDLLITVIATKFYDFDEGKEITQNFPKEWNLQRGEIVRWVLAQFDGFAEIISCTPEGVCVFRKIS